VIWKWKINFVQKSKNFRFLCVHRFFPLLPVRHSTTDCKKNGMNAEKRHTFLEMCGKAKKAKFGKLR
jgi:hypothetical protein